MIVETFSRFRHQSLVAHVSLIIAGAVAFYGGTYVAAEVWYGGAEVLLAEGADAAATRRRCLRVGFTLCWLVFALGTLKAVGGPLLNTIWYPGAILIGASSVLPTLLGGPTPHPFWSDAILLGPRFAREVAAMTLPGILLYTVIVVGAMQVVFDSETEFREWAGENLSESFLEAAWDDYEDGEWTDLGDR